MADLICAARRVVTMTGKTSEAFACRGEWVVATGSLAELRERFSEAQVRDFGDACIVPGFNDAHQHPSICAEQSLHVDLSPERVPDTDALVGALRDRAADTPAGEWVVGFGYDPFRSNGGRDLTRDELDSACPRHPVLVVHVTLHAGAVNSAGLRRAGWEQASDAPPGGELGVDPEGRLTGVVHDQALYDLAFPAFTRAQTIVPAAARADLVQALCTYLMRLHASGITSVTDALVGPDWWAVLQSLASSGRLTARMNALAAYEHFDRVAPVGQGSADALARLRLGGVKTFADGAVNGGMCLLDEPALGTAGAGLARMAKDELAAVVRTVHDAGWRVCVHANGDRAIRWTLDAIDAAQRDRPRADPRHRIEHASVVTAELIGRMRRSGVVAVPFANYALAHGDKLRGFYGDQRAEGMFAHRAMLDAGVPVAGSSDHPCGPYEPLFAMRSCVERADRHGEPFGASQRIVPREALALYTVGAAYSSQEEATKGRLAPGYLADFTVLDADPLTTPAAELTGIAVLQTWVGAQCVWAAP